MKKLTNEIFQEYQNFSTWTVFEAAAILSNLDPENIDDKIYRHTKFLEVFKKINDAGYESKFRMWDKDGNEYTPQRREEEFQRTVELLRSLEEKDGEKNNKKEKIDGNLENLERLQELVEFWKEDSDSVVFSEDLTSDKYLINESKVETVDPLGVLRWASSEGIKSLGQTQQLNIEVKDNDKAEPKADEVIFGNVLGKFTPEINTFWDILKRQAKDRSGRIDAVPDRALYDLALESYGICSKNLKYLKKSYIDDSQFYENAADRRKKIIGNILRSIITDKCPKTLSKSSGVDTSIEGLFTKFKKNQTNL